MLRSIFYPVFVTTVISGVLVSQASAGKLQQAGSTGKHIPEGKLTLRPTAGSPGPKGNIEASPRDASTGLPTGKRR
jgi:hypothetical protein